MVGRRLGCCLYIVRVSLEPQASAALLLARNITGRLRELCVHRPWTMLSRSSSRRRVASCSYAAFYRENRIIGRNTGRTTGNTRPRFSLPSRTAVITLDGTSDLSILGQVGSISDRFLTQMGSPRPCAVRRGGRRVRLRSDRVLHAAVERELRARLRFVPRRSRHGDGLGRHRDRASRVRDAQRRAAEPA